MGLVALLVVLNHLPYDIQLSFWPNGHVADVKYLVLFFFCCCLFLFFSKVQIYLCASCASTHDQSFPMYLRLKLLHLLPC